jgi:hypothetical protein
VAIFSLRSLRAVFSVFSAGKSKGQRIYKLRFRKFWEILGNIPFIILSLPICLVIIARNRAHPLKQEEK